MCSELPTDGEWKDAAGVVRVALTCWWWQGEPRSFLNHKLVLLGDTSVGKSCLAVRFVFPRHVAACARRLASLSALVDDRVTRVAL